MCVLIHTFSVQSPDDNRSRKHMQDKRLTSSVPGLVTSCIRATLANATTIDKNHTAWTCFKQFYSGREAVPAAPWNCRLQKPILADIATRVHGTCQVANFRKCSSFASLASTNHDFWGACFIYCRPSVIGTRVWRKEGCTTAAMYISRCGYIWCNEDKSTIWSNHPSHI